MSYEPLHHKYRPHTFAQLVGQEAIAATLTNALKSEKIAPAYLFTGPRGTGKTSSARILAKSLNCLNSDQPTPNPCGKCNVCESITRGTALDVIEIDAASNTGVDNIREIIEKAQFSPVQCRYKVYVIDECHMLSTAAFNALLKTLEEPPERVIFVLATTDPQRVLPTIISRCQRFDYRRIPLESMVKHLKYIATQENIDITDSAISLVAQIANGGLRDAESLLDQLSLLSDTITPEKVWDLVGAVPEQDLLQLIQAIAKDDVEEVLTLCRKLMDRGREPLVVLQNLGSFYLNLLIAKNAPNRSDLIAVTDSTWQLLCQEAQNWDTRTILEGQKRLKDSEVQIKNTTQPRLWLEVTLLSLLPSALKITPVLGREEPTNFAPSHAPSAPEKQTNYPQEKPSISSCFPTPTPVNLEEKIPATNQPNLTEYFSVDQLNIEETWEKVIHNLQFLMSKEFFKQQCNLLFFDGKIARISLKNKILLKVAQDKIPDLQNSFKKIFNQDVRIVFEVDNTEVYSENKEQKSSPKEAKIEAPKQQDLADKQRLDNIADQTSDNITINEENELPMDSENVRKAAEFVAKNFQGEIVEEIDIKFRINREPITETDDDDIPF